MSDKSITQGASLTDRFRHPKFTRSKRPKNKFFPAVVILLMTVYTSYAQTPTLGSAANFVIFTGTGAITHTGTSLITGNIGSNSGSATGFGNVNGVMHSGDATTASCAADLLTAYNQLNTATPTATIASPIGNGVTYTAGVYHIASAAVLNLNLILNGQGNANAVFIFQVDGSFATNALSSITLTNGALACNVFWKVEGQVSMAANTTMRGNIIAHNAAITMGTGDTLEGRALSTAGAVSVSSIFAFTPIGCGSTYLTGPNAPTFVASGAYDILSGNGPVTNTGITQVAGDVGTNVGLTIGFNPLLVQGTIHSVPDASTASAASDLTTVYNYLNGLSTDIELLYPAQFGNNLILTPHTYLMNSATTFTGSVFLDAENNANAIFVIKVNGAFATSTFAKVILVNGAQAKNVYWKVDGAVNIAANSTFNGNIIANNGAITTGLGDTVTGRLLTTNGAISINGGYYATPATCTAPAITGSNHVCAGDTTTLANATAGGTWSSSNPLVATINPSSGLVTGVASGSNTITYVTTAGCTATLAFTVNPSPLPVTGPSAVCAGATITLSDLTLNGTWSSNNVLAATVNSATGVVTGINAGTPTISYTLATGCAAIKTIAVNTSANAGTIAGPSTVCAGSSIILTDAVTGGTWSAANTNATVVNGVVTGVLAGTDNITYTVTNGCGTAAANQLVTITNTAPNAGVITGPSSVCVGSSITLTDAANGGTWSTSNGNATVTGGITTGVLAGTDNIIYTVTNACGTATATKPITINPLPDAGTIAGPSSVCTGSSITLTDGATGGTWSASNTNATVVAGITTGVTAGSDNIVYTVVNGCGTATATHAVQVNPIPNAGTITGPSSVCVNASVILTDTAAGGTWSASNANATVAGGLVTGITAGTDNIVYTVTNVCGIATTSFAIQVNPLPNAGTISGPSSVCTGSSITLTDTANGTWSAINTNATVAGGTITGAIAGIDTIKYTVVNGCGTAIAVHAVTVDLLPAMPVIATKPPASVCTGVLYQNFGAATAAPASTTYTWTAVNAQVWAQGAGHQYSLVSFDTTGNAFVTLTATATGTACTSKTTAAINVGASVAPIPTVRYFNEHFVCTPNNENSYQWGYDDVITLDSTILTGEINQDYLNTNADFQNKLYWVMTNVGGCSQKTYYTIPSGVKQVSNNTGISIYPNPAKQFINVAIQGPATGNVQVYVMNMLGQVLITNDVADNKASINIANLSAGAYIVNCYRDGIKIAASRFIKN